MKKKKRSVMDICQIGLFAAVCAVLAQISIPMPVGVPLTMQTFAVTLAGVVLGPGNGFVAVLVYVLLGAVGAPVYANFTGGPAILFGKTGGFLLTFPLMAMLSGLGARSKRPMQMAAGITAGMVVNYLGGMVMFHLITGSGLWTAFIYVVLPYVPTGLLKAAAAVLLGNRIKKSRVLEAAAA